MRHVIGAHEWSVSNCGPDKANAREVVASVSRASQAMKDSTHLSIMTFDSLSCFSSGWKRGIVVERETKRGCSTFLGIFILFELRFLIIYIDSAQALEI